MIQKYMCTTYIEPSTSGDWESNNNESQVSLAASAVDAGAAKMFSDELYHFILQ